MSESEVCIFDVVRELEERISFLEEGLDQLTDVVKEMSDYIRKEDVR